MDGLGSFVDVGSTDLFKSLMLGRVFRRVPKTELGAFSDATIGKNEIGIMAPPLRSRFNKSEKLTCCDFILRWTSLFRRETDQMSSSLPTTPDDKFRESVGDDVESIPVISGSDSKKSKGPTPDLVSGADAGAADEDLKFYLSGLFNIETSPAFKQIESLKAKKDIPPEK